MKCPACGAEASGSFCGECGAPLKAAKCKSCNGQLVPGARFCNHCGEPVRGGTSGKLPWFIAGGALVLLLIALLVPGLTRQDSNEQAGPIDAGAAPFAQSGDQGGNGSPPPLTGTPREQADRLFNRIMELKEQGDTARAKFFVPMGLQAYEMAAPLDDDGFYHLSLLQTFSGDGALGRKTADQVLAKNPTHLLALIAAAEGADAAGDKAAAKGYYARFLKAYDSETAKKLEEYVDHERILPEYRKEAEAYN